MNTTISDIVKRNVGSNMTCKEYLVLLYGDNLADISEECATDLITRHDKGADYANPYGTIDFIGLKKELDADAAFVERHAEAFYKAHK